MWGSSFPNALVASCSRKFEDFMVCVCILVLIVGLRQGFAHGRHCCIRELHPFSRVPWDCAILSPHPCHFCSLFFNAGSHVAQASASPKKLALNSFCLLWDYSQALPHPTTRYFCLFSMFLIRPYAFQPVHHSALLLMSESVHLSLLCPLLVSRGRSLRNRSCRVCIFYQEPNF